MVAFTIEEFLRENEQKELLRFSTAGSIDDGKSTLIGRLLHDSKNVYEDVLASVRKTSRDRRFEGEEMDFSLLTDGLKAEREQGITIDVAYRYFSTPRRKFIIADTPGHEQYTRNMATGASTANLAVILIDARNGVLPQTKRHAFIASLLGVPHLVVAINKMDAVGYDQTVYERIRAEFESFARKLTIRDIRFLPISALKGDNVVHRSDRMPWYDGESLLELLETIYIGSDYNLIDLRFPVQLVLRPNMNFRGYAGTVASGVLRRGDSVMVLPSRVTSRVRQIVTWEGEIEEAYPPMSVVVTLEDERDISRGDMLVHCHNQPRVERHFEAMVVWMDTQPMDPEKIYYIKHTTHTTRARVDEVRYKVDVNELHRREGSPLALNEIGRVVFTAHRPLLFDPYPQNRATGSFILIDPLTHATAAAGMIIEREPEDVLPSRIVLRSASPAAPMGLIRPEERARRYRQRPATLWFTGLTGAGKSTIAETVERRLFDAGATCVVLDGETLRLGLSRELEFSAADRAEHQRRAAEVARVLNDAGQIVLASFVSPDAEIRRQVRERIGPDRFLEILVEAPIELCRQRKPDFYHRADRGEARQVPGVDRPYEPPSAPDLILNTSELAVEAAVEEVLRLLRERGIFPLPEGETTA